MSEEAVRAAMAGTTWMHGEREDKEDGRKVFFTIF